MHNELLIIIQ